MKSIQCSIKGISGILMHRYPTEPIDNPPIEKRSREEQAELAAYRDPDGELFIPGAAVQRSFVNAATYSKGKGRATLMKPTAAGVFISPERLLLGTKEYEIDSRPVVIQKARIMRHRPVFYDWAVSFRIDYDDSLLIERQVRQIVDDSGARVGLLDFRPPCKGPFGRFIVTEWKVIN